MLGAKQPSSRLRSVADQGHRARCQRHTQPSQSGHTHPSTPAASQQVELGPAHRVPGAASVGQSRGTAPLGSAPLP